MQRRWSRERPWRCPRRVALRAFDLARYGGGPDRPPAYSDIEMTLLVAGTAALILALHRPTAAQMHAEASANAAQNRARFHPRPRRVKWRGEYR